MLGLVVPISRWLLTSLAKAFSWLWANVINALTGLSMGAVVAGLLQQADPLGIGQWVGYGVGGLVAVLVMNWKRIDDQAHNKALEAIIARYEAHMTTLLGVIRDSTTAMVAMEKTIANQDQFEKLRDDMDDLKGRKQQRGGRDAGSNT